MRIRLAEPGDGPRLAAIYAPAVVNSTISVEFVAPDGAEMTRRISDTLPRLPWLVAETDLVLGYAYASPHRLRAAYAWSAEVSIYIAPEAHHQGLGRALYTSLFNILRLQGYHTVFAGITAPNPASTALHASLGFALIGTYPRVAYKLGRWLDTRWYSLPLSEYPLEPPHPEPLPVVRERPGFAEALASGLGRWRPAR